MPGMAMVTGASSGMGTAYAERLAADGWNLVVVARRLERLNELAARLSDSHGVTVRAIQADLGHADDVQRVCEEIDAVPVDMLVNNAGLAHYMPFAELSSARARELVDLNVLAPVLLSGAAVAGMLARAGGTIINVASLLAFSGAEQAHFCRSGSSTRRRSRSWLPSASCSLLRCTPGGSRPGGMPGGGAL